MAVSFALDENSYASQAVPRPQANLREIYDKLDSMNGFDSLNSSDDNINKHIPINRMCTAPCSRYQVVLSRKFLVLKKHAVARTKISDRFV